MIISVMFNIMVIDMFAVVVVSMFTIILVVITRASPQDHAGLPPSSLKPCLRTAATGGYGRARLRW